MAQDSETTNQNQPPFLTDPVTPEEKPPAEPQKPSPPSSSLPKPPQSKQKPPKKSKKRKPQKPPKPTSNKPAKPPTSSKLPLIITILLILSAAGAGVYFYLQNQTLKQQLSTIQSTIQQPTPSPSPSPTASPAASPNSYPTVSPSPTATPSPTPSTKDLSAFKNLEAVINLARQKHSQAQLLMITTTNAADNPAYKYWFRRQPNTKAYFFIKQTFPYRLKYISSATISPDNQIPDLIPLWQQDQLGQSDQDLLPQARQEIQTKTNANPTSINAKFIKARPSNPDLNQQINIWQFTFNFSTQSSLVIQYNPLTQNIVYKNF